MPDAELPTGAPECSAIAERKLAAAKHHSLLSGSTPFYNMHYDLSERARACQGSPEGLRASNLDCSREFRQNVKHGSACVRYRRTTTVLMDGICRYALLLRFVFKKYRDPGLSGVEPCVRKRTH